MTNQEVANAWVTGKKEKGKNSTGALWFDGDKLFSYQTIIGQRKAGKIFLNSRKYSVTTSGKHVTPVVHACIRAGVIPMWIEGPGMGGKKL